MTVRDGTASLSLFLRLFARLLWIVLVGLSVVVRPGTAQDLDLRPLPLPQGEFLASPSIALPSSPDAEEKQDPRAMSARGDVQKGTSNDRILWTLPNFLTMENAKNVPPLTPGQKFKVTARGLFDPFEFVLIGVVAGINQAADSNPSYGQGMEGYAKRYATAYGDNLIENFMSSAVLPSILHQDPRYYQLGHGGFWRRSAHAVGRVLVTRSDSGQQQPNYSEVVGAAAAAAISTYSYHPESERGFGNVASVWGSQMGWDAVTYMIKEFWPDLRDWTKKNKQGSSNAGTH
jgi:hypothetical protein